MNETEKEILGAQRRREREDPGETERPLPWFLIMLMGAMAMWGAFYIYSTPSGEWSALGDQRTMASLRPELPAVGGVQKIDGKLLYGSKCSACHQASGQGVAGVFPPLAASEWVVGDEKVLARILLHGVEGSLEVKGISYSGAMPAWKSMSDDELAAVMSYIRSDWNNSAAPIKAETVRQIRDETKDRTEPFKGGAELKSTA